MKYHNAVSSDTSAIIQATVSSPLALLEKAHIYYATSSSLSFDTAIHTLTPLDMFETVLAKLEENKKAEKQNKENQESEDQQTDQATEEKAAASEEDSTEKPKNEATTPQNTESNDDANDANSTEANVGGSTTQANRYPTPLPDPLSIRDGWDEDYTNIGIGSNAAVTSEERNLNIFAPGSYIESFYDEVLPATVAIDCGCSCDCNLGGQWILTIFHSSTEFGEDSEIFGIINSITLNFSTGQSFTSNAPLSWNDPTGGFAPFVFFLGAMYIDVTDVCTDSDSPVTLTVTLDIDVPNADGLFLTLFSPNDGAFITLLGQNINDTSSNPVVLGYEGVYLLDDSNLALPDISLNPAFDNDGGSPDGDIDPDTYNTIFSSTRSLADFILDACHPDTDSSSSQQTFPIIFDLDGQGFDLLSTEDAKVLFDVNNDGVKEQSAWFGPGDGMLIFDWLDDGQVTNVNEFAFKNWHPNANSDLEGLQLVFDSNKDNVLDAQDSAWKQMGIWQDSNQNGVSDNGEYSSLDDLGIISINLSSDGHLQMINGNTILGTLSAQKANGESVNAADVALSYSEVAPIIPPLQEMADT